MDILRAYVGELAQSELALAQTAALFLGLEMFWSRPGVRVSLASRFKAVLFWTMFSALAIVVAHVLTLVWAPLGVRPLLPTLAPPALPAPIAAAVGAIAAAYIGDLCYYWMHRAQHHFGFLWRFHAVHHSVRELSGVATYHHISEELVSFALYTIPLSFLVDTPYSIPIFGFILAQQGNYLHSPVRLNFGPLGRYFVDNRFHRIHHSIDERHYDKNFGLFTTLWDSLFGTAYFPATNEWPESGVTNAPEPESIADFLLLPFRLEMSRSGIETQVAQGRAEIQKSSNA
jgi:sterol desaturase/sphingolipid hydroxylase (fatty acid hydroxylase superfamily)